MIYYVYALYASERPGIPFYIGKGKKSRAASHVRRAINGEGPRASYIKAVIRRGGTISHKKLVEGLTEEEAFGEEKRLIAFFGRKPLGPLLNFSDGGEGNSGYRFTEEVAKRHREAMNKPEMKEKMRKVFTGRKLSPSHIEAIVQGLTGRKRSAEDLAKNREAYAANGRLEACKEASRKANLGRKLSETHRAAISKAHKGKPKPLAQRLKIAESNRRTKALRRAVS